MDIYICHTCNNLPPTPRTDRQPLFNLSLELFRPRGLQLRFLLLPFRLFLGLLVLLLGQRSGCLFASQLLLSLADGGLLRKTLATTSPMTIQ